jgi:phage-related protein
VKAEREIIFHKQYFQDFYIELSDSGKEKIGYVFHIIKTVDRIPDKFLKHLSGTDGLYEIRLDLRSNIYRIFCCFDKGNLIVLFNAFQKKTQKTPNRQIDLALKLKKEYFNSKGDKA